MESENEVKKSLYTPALKKAIYKWRETHQQHFREYANNWANENYSKNSEKYKEQAKERYRKKQEILKANGIEKKPRGRPKKIKDEIIKEDNN